MAVGRISTPVLLQLLIQAMIRGGSNWAKPILGGRSGHVGFSSRASGCTDLCASFGINALPESSLEHVSVVVVVVVIVVVVIVLSWICM